MTSFQYLSIIIFCAVLLYFVDGLFYGIVLGIWFVGVVGWIIEMIKEL